MAMLASTFVIQKDKGRVRSPISLGESGVRVKSACGVKSERGTLESADLEPLIEP